MQLNTLTLNSCSPPTFSSSQLAVYDHNMAIVNTQVFVYGKNIKNFTIQTPLHKINLITLRIEPVFTVNAPLFSHVMMFSFEQHIYFWGKTALSQENELYEFDGLKFTKLDQFGPTPTLNGPYSFTKFSHRYLLLFNCLNGIQFLNKWYLFDIKQRQWKQIVQAVQIPVSEKSQIIWKNGRGYLLLQSCYDKITQQFSKNLLYEIKFTNLTKLVLELTEIPLPSHMKELDIVFTNIFCVDEKRLMILGGQQICVSQKQVQNESQIPVQSKLSKSEIDFKNTKIIFQFDLESFQWISQFKTLPLKGQHHKIFTFDNKIYTIGGTFGDSLLKEIQSYDMQNEENDRKFTYEQSLCYYCECAFTYEQKYIYGPAIQREYETFEPRNRVENKFLRKFAQSISTEIHAIGIMCEYLIDKKSNHIQITLCQEVRLHPRDLAIKQRIQYEASQILTIKSSTHQSPSLTQMVQAVTGDENSMQSEYFSINMTKIKLASFKLGYGLLYVTSTQEGHIFVSYASYSQTDLPQSNFKSFSEIYYTITWNRNRKIYECSSQNKRNIIFQNVKMHFGCPQVYENIEEDFKVQKSNHFVCTYIIGVSNLEKALCIEPPKSKFIEDIKIKSLNKKNPTNSLRKYLKHLYLVESIGFKLTLQNVEVQFMNVYEKFEEFAKIMELREIPTNDEAYVKKAENEETHFSTNQDEVLSWKKIDIIDHCKLYEVPKSQLNSLSSVYNYVFIYHDKKLLKTLKTKKSTIWGVIELLNGGNFAHKSDERRLLKWMQQIESTIIEQQYPSAEDE